MTTETTKETPETRIQATPRPWFKQSFTGLTPCTCIYDDSSARKRTTIARVGGPGHEANAELIVRSVNNFENVLHALKNAHAALTYHPNGDTRSEVESDACDAIRRVLEAGAFLGFATLEPRGKHVRLR